MSFESKNTEPKTIIRGTGPKDDGKRPRYGVNTTALMVGADTVRLIFDDLIQSETGSGVYESWRHMAFFTSMELDREAFEALDLPQDDLARIGYLVLLRLSALHKVH